MEIPEDLMTEEKIRDAAVLALGKDYISLWRPFDILFISKSLILSDWARWNDEHTIDGGDAAKEQCNSQYANVGLLGALIFTVAVELVLLLDPSQGTIFSGSHATVYAYLSISCTVALACCMLIAVFFTLVLNELGDDDALQWLASMGKLEQIPVTSLILGLLLMVVLVVLFTFDVMEVGDWIGLWFVNGFLVLVPFLVFPLFRGVQDLNGVSKTNDILKQDNKKNFTLTELNQKLEEYTKIKSSFDYAEKKEFLEWLCFDTDTYMKPKKNELTESTTLRAKKLFKDKMNAFVHQQ